MTAPGEPPAIEVEGLAKHFVDPVRSRPGLVQPRRESPVLIAAVAPGVSLLLS